MYFNPNEVSTQMTILKFATFNSDIELHFYTSLAYHKINHDKLDDSARRLLGLYELCPDDRPDSSCRMRVHGNALAADEFFCPRNHLALGCKLSLKNQGSHGFLSS